MKEKISILVVGFIMVSVPINILGHPGRTDSKGCHTCRTNCLNWGLEYEEYHCHSGNTYSNSRGQIFNSDGSLIKSNSQTNNNFENNNSSNNSNNIDKPNNVNHGNSNNAKSNISTLSTLSIDNNNINISSKMTFTTTNDLPVITANATDNKAKITIDKKEKLSYGDNQILITVTSEDLTVTIYKLNIKLVSDDATLKDIKIGNKSVQLTEEMTINTNEEKITIIPISNNKNAKIIYEKTYNLNVGNNPIVINVIAEDGVSKKEYILNINRQLKLSDDVSIKATINGKEALFSNYKSEVIYISSDVNELDIKIDLSDKNAKLNLDYDKKISTGTKVIKFKVTSESGKEQEYELNIYKYSKIEEVISLGIGVVTLTGIGFATYKSTNYIKNRVSKKK